MLNMGSDSGAEYYDEDEDEDSSGEEEISGEYESEEDS